MQTIGAGQCAKPQIGQDKPLRRSGVVIGVGAFDTGAQRIDPCGLVLQGFPQRQTCGHRSVQAVLHHARSRPDILRDGAREHVLFPLAQRLAEIAVLHGAQKVPVTDPAQLQLDGVGVDRLDRQRGLRPTGQHVGTAGKPH